MNTPEYQIVKQYAQALQKENQAKQLQHQTLYRHLNALEQQLAQMERYYFIYYQINRELQELREQLAVKDCQLIAFHVLEKSVQQKTQTIQKMENLVAQKEHTIDLLEQELQMMDDRQYKMRQQLQSQQRMTAKLHEDKDQLIKVVKQLEKQVNYLNSCNVSKNCSTYNQSHFLVPQNNSESQIQMPIKFEEQEISNLIGNYQAIQSELQRQKEKCLALENEIVQFGFLLQSKDNELEAKNIKVRQLESRLLYGEMKKTLSISSKSSAKLSMSDVFTEHLFKTQYENEGRFNSKTQRTQFRKQSNSTIQNEVRTQYNYQIPEQNDKQRLKPKGQTRLQLRNQLLKIQNEGLLQQLSI